MLNELNSTKMELVACHSIILELQQQLNSTNLLVQAMLIELTTRQHHQETWRKLRLFDKFIRGDLSFGLTDEVRLAIGSHKLPLGYSRTSGSDEVIMPVGAGCLKFQDELVQYMAYDYMRLVGSAQLMMFLLKGSCLRDVNHCLEGDATRNLRSSMSSQLHFRRVFG
ncbi:hypothetical protein Ddye_001431 [Dipteronia dyeriana]|uniref:Uncharacterized protein n=1 Tax=Dipteronia dyeriana TaxID=168575 RepID=A0AAD9XP10_9ROSI|nr:hypothetical protein Ddye_001431 [Dipteronia dyeriana]